MSETKIEQKECPYCKEDIKFNALKCKHCGSMLEPELPDHGGVCPYCKEIIKSEAIKCKHCKSNLQKRPLSNFRPDHGNFPPDINLPPFEDWPIDEDAALEQCRYRCDGSVSKTQYRSCMSCCRWGIGCLDDPIRICPVGCTFGTYINPFGQFVQGCICPLPFDYVIVGTIPINP